MELLALILPSLPGILLAILTKDPDFRLWIILLTVWLCVPLGIMSSLVFGFWISSANQCNVNGRITEHCEFLGVDVMDWIDGLASDGYAIVFVGLLWFVIGGVLLGLARLILVRKEIS